MTDINMLPDTHCFDDDSQTDVWSYSAGLVSELIEAARQEGRDEAADITEECIVELVAARDSLRAKLAVATEALETIHSDPALFRVVDVVAVAITALAKIKEVV